MGWSDWATEVDAAGPPGSWALSDVLIAALVAGAVSVAVAIMLDVRQRTKARNDVRLTAAADLLAAMQTLVRRMTDIALGHYRGLESEGWGALHDAAIGWNSARYKAILLGTQKEIKVLHDLDVELDRLMDKVLEGKWKSSTFRAEKEPLGGLGADYVNAIRRATKQQPPFDMKSIWSWSQLRAYDPEDRSVL